jgi:predicted enzyme related to lactoylglutathione lyase
MVHGKKSYCEHVAVRVKDIGWHIRFFGEVFGMTLRKVDGAEEFPKQVWTIGGVLLISDPDFAGPEGRIAHLGIMVEDLEAALDEAYVRGAAQMPQGRNWIRLPDGLCIEVMQASDSSVADILSVDPRA